MIDIIIPCYNEAARFNKKLFFSYLENLEQVHIIFVNDGSTDGTREMLNQIKTESISINEKTPITILNLDKNMGKAEAIREGVLFSMQNPKTENIAYFDADFSTPLTEITNLYRAMKEDTKREMILGSRIKKAGSTIERSQMRHYSGRIMATIVNNTILKIPIYDTQCGAKLITKRCAEIIFSEPFVSRWLFDIELISRLQVRYSKKSLKEIMYEQPLKTWVEMGDSKIRFKDLLRIPYQLFLIYKKQTNDEKNLGKG
ncbi:glycosyltransferase [Aequorivita echinoideorum]|uniref:Glycosyltransferase n=1 Tax=Aequorivita echinoideorum TaxID=1549647 RepID=A0ABS5S933_9FLAO|nr:glycosyltransferase [Aequorivita echinoideorum]MBT0608847.1 glycosyltransferase [Aequorivita echinoideorum]